MKKIALLMSLVFVSSAFCESVSEVLQAKLNAMHSLTANFKQVIKAKQREISSTSGTMALERPGRFRWQTNDPMQQLVVADGEKLWVYDVDLEQVSVKKQEKELGGTAALFLSSYDNTLTRDFDVTPIASGNEQSFDLHSKSSKANFQRLKLIFKQDVLNRIEMYDQLGQHTVITLTDVKLNPQIAADLFQFKPPKGTDVVQQ
jgi:outer membrane lipoprotein carrier protein